MSRPFQVKNKDGSLKYGGQWCIKFKDPSGNYRVQVAGSNEKDAARLLRGILTDIDRGTWIDPRARRASTKWGNAVVNFELYKRQQRLSKGTYRSIGRCIKILSSIIDSDVDLGSLKKNNISAIIDNVLKLQISDAYKNLIFTYFKAIFKYATKLNISIPKIGDLPNGKGVYLIQNGNSNRYKIGIAQNIKRRIAELNCSNPDRVGLLFFYPCINAQYLERRIHNNFKKYRINNEWFDLDKNQVSECIEFIKDPRVCDHVNHAGPIPGPLLTIT